MKTPSRTTPYTTKHEAVAAEDSMAGKQTKLMDRVRNSAPVQWKECGSLMRA